MLHDDGDFVGITRYQPIGDFNIRMHCIQGNEEMMLSWKPVIGHALQNFFYKAAHRPIHDISVV